MMDPDTTLRCLGYALDFLQVITITVVLLMLTGRLAR